MNVVLDVPDYSPQSGLHLVWDEGFTVRSSMISGEIVISANAAGLTSLARHLLVLAQASVPTGNHFHLEVDSGLEEASIPMIFEKV